jgi:hypothetical protein
MWLPLRVQRGLGLASVDRMTWTRAMQWAVGRYVGAAVLLIALVHVMSGSGLGRVCCGWRIE